MSSLNTLIGDVCWFPNHVRYQAERRCPPRAEGELCEYTTRFNIMCCVGTLNHVSYKAVQQLRVSSQNTYIGFSCAVSR